MLVGVDHIALTGRNTDAQKELLRQSGYGEVFETAWIPNPENKQSLMEKWTQQHTLALYRRAESVPIEIITYGHIADGESRFELQSELGPLLTAAEVTENTATSQRKRDLNTIQVRTPDTAATRSFFESLGFQGGSVDELTFQAPMDSISITLNLIEDSSAADVTYLDTAGFPCLALVSTNIETERNRLHTAGYRVTDSKRIKLPEKSLEVAFTVGPTGVPVELVSPN